MTHPLDRARDHLARHVKFDSTHGAETAALWAAHTWFLAPGEDRDPDRAIWHTPRLLVSASGPSCGKSTLLDYLTHLSRDAEMVGSATTASLWGFSEDGQQPTVAYDEGDVTIDPYGPIRSLINDGFEPGRGRTLRNGDSKNRGQIRQSAYFPLALSGNDLKLADDSATRTIEIVLTRAKEGEFVPEYPWHRYATAGGIGDALGAWAHDPATVAAVREARDTLDGFDRNTDKWRALRQVAHAAGGTWPQVAAALAASDGVRCAGGEDGPVNAHIAFLHDLRAIWPAHTSFMSTRQILARLADHNPNLWDGRTSKHGPVTGSDVHQWIKRATASAPHLDIGTVKGTDPETGKRVRGRSQWLMEQVWTLHGIERDISPTPVYMGTL